MNRYEVCVSLRHFEISSALLFNRVSVSVMIMQSLFSTGHGLQLCRIAVGIGNFAKDRAMIGVVGDSLP